MRRLVATFIFLVLVAIIWQSSRDRSAPMPAEVPMPAEGSEPDLRRRFPITGCEAGELLVPEANLWSGAGGITAGQRVMGTLSGTSDEDRCQGDVVVEQERQNGRRSGLLQGDQRRNGSFWLGHRFVRGVRIRYGHVCRGFRRQSRGRRTVPTVAVNGEGRLRWVSARRRCYDSSGAHQALKSCSRWHAQEDSGWRQGCCLRVFSTSQPLLQR